MRSAATSLRSGNRNAAVRTQDAHAVQLMDQASSPQIGARGTKSLLRSVFCTKI